LEKLRSLGIDEKWSQIIIKERIAEDNLRDNDLETVNYPFQIVQNSWLYFRSISNLDITI
jgi:hypothetical protein